MATEVYMSKIEGIARYAGLLPALMEGFGHKLRLFFVPMVNKRFFLITFLPIFAHFMCSLENLTKNFEKLQTIFKKKIYIFI